ncbi:RDD family protein [Bizionia arctica]|nr:RDD family protein [Bizionia arctica]
MEIINQTYGENPQKAEWWRRLIGFSIDIIGYFILLWIVYYLIELLSIGYLIEDASIVFRYIYFYFFYIFYYVLFESLTNRTLGKIITGTIVINSLTFKKPSLGQIFGRSFSRLIPFDFISFISSKPRGWHDSIPNTMVTTIKSKHEFKTINKIDL